MLLTEHGCRFITDPALSGAELLTGGKHTYKDFGLVPTARLTVKPPPDETPTVKIPGAIEAPTLRLEAAFGGPRFGMREGSWEFRAKTRRLWPYAYSALLNFVQGRELRAILDDDPGYYYVGTVRAEDWKSDAVFSTATLAYTFRPYKYEIVTSLEQWLWSPFSFIDGVIRKYGQLEVTGSRTLTVIGSPLPVTPRFRASKNGVTMTYNSVTYSLEKDAWVAFDGVTLGDGEHALTFAGTFEGTAKVDVDYRGGRL